MLREYFIIGRYIADLPEDSEFENLVLQEFKNDILHMKDSKSINSYVEATFSVIKGDEIEIEDYENEKN